MAKPPILSIFALTHLAVGDCFLASGCELCTPAAADDPCATPHLHTEAARDIWDHHREALTAQWAAHLKSRHESDGGLPMYSAILFDGARFPGLSPNAPEAVKKRHRYIEAALAALEHRKSQG